MRDERRGLSYVEQLANLVNVSNIRKKISSYVRSHLVPGGRMGLSPVRYGNVKRKIKNSNKKAINLSKPVNLSKRKKVKKVNNEVDLGGGFVGREIAADKVSDLNDALNVLYDNDSKAVYALARKVFNEQGIIRVKIDGVYHTLQYNTYQETYDAIFDMLRNYNNLSDDMKKSIIRYADVVKWYSGEDIALKSLTADKAFRLRSEELMKNMVRAFGKPTVVTNKRFDFGRSL